MLSEAINRYENHSLTTMQLIEHLIAFAKELRGEPKRAEEMDLSEDEPAFYDALAQSESAMQVLGDTKLRAIARDLVKACVKAPRSTGTFVKAFALAFG